MTTYIQMRFATILTITLISLGRLIAQPISEEFGTVFLEEFAIDSCANENNPEAVVLLDDAKIYFIEYYPETLDRRLTRHKKIKINKQSGVEQSQIVIPYYTDLNGIKKTEEVFKIKALCHFTLNGQLYSVKMKKSDIQDIKIDEYTRAKTFTIPHVRENTIIEYTYSKITPFDEIEHWYFDSDIPTLNSSIEIRKVPFFNHRMSFFGDQSKLEYNFYHDNAGKPRHFSLVSFHEVVHTYKMKNIGSIKKTPISRRQRLEFSFLAKMHPMFGVTENYLSDWQGINTNLLSAKDFGQFIDKAQYRCRTSEVWKELTTLENKDERLSKLYDAVQHQFSSVGNDSVHVSQNLNTFEKQRAGNVASTNLYLTGLLRIAGFDAHPIIIRTNDKGPLNKKFPMQKSFNYVIAMVKTGDEIVLLDASAPDLEIDTLPTKCINDAGLVIAKNGPTWIDLRSRQITTINPTE